MCITPLELVSDKRDISTGFLVRKVPCGKCHVCLKRRANAWVFRMLEEAKVSENVSFWTWTYDDEHLEYTPSGLPTLNKKTFQKFIKRLRKYSNSPNLKYYAAGEYGENTQRPHYHAILFNLDPVYMDLSYVDQDKQAGNMVRTWNRGLIHRGEGNELTMRYVAKYIQKKQVWKPIINEDTGEVIVDDRVKEFSLMSQKIGLSSIINEDGSFTKLGKWIKEQKVGYITIRGIKTALPRYFKEKIFTEQERSELTYAANKYREENEITDDYRKMSIINYKQKEYLNSLKSKL